MLTLKDRRRPIPNGFKFRQPQTGWQAPAWASFETIVQALIAHRQGNLYLTQKHRWATDYNAVAAEVDTYNAKLCEVNGWTEFLVSPSAEAPPPKFKALAPFSGKQLNAVADKVKKVWQGVRSLNDWFDSKEPAVAATLSQQRAEVCAKCPVNGQGGLEEWFTKPASEIIKRQVARASERNLKTTVDDNLNVCTACLCPLRLLVHVPLDFKLAHMGEETRKALDYNCWILREEKERLSK